MSRNALMRRDGLDYNAGLLAVVWLITAAAMFSLCAKLYARYQRFKRFYWDDFFVILAWNIAVPLAVQATISFGRDVTLDSGQPNIFLSRPVTQFFYYTTLWCVKFSFLIFFRRIGACALPGLRKFWTVVLWVTIITYFAIWGVNPYGCWAEKGVQRCETEANVKVMRPVAMGIATTLVTTTDILILAIPMVLLSSINKLEMRKRVILYSLFLVEVVTVMVAIVRCVVATKGMNSSQDLQVTLLLFLTHLEANIAIIIACVGSLRSLFTQDDQSKPSLNATPKSQAVRVNGKVIGPPHSVRSVPLTVFSSSHSHKRDDSMTIPLSHFSAQPARQEGFDSRTPNDIEIASKEYLQFQIAR